MRGIKVLEHNDATNQITNQTKEVDQMAEIIIVHIGHLFQELFQRVLGKPDLSEACLY